MNKKALRKQEREIKKLRSLIPEFPTCIEGCTDCCGHVHWTEWEWLQVKENKLLQMHQDNPFSCPFSSNGNCDVYEHRPIVCRLYGHIEDDERMLCPHGIRPVRMLPKSLFFLQRIINKWDTLMGESHFSGRRTLALLADKVVHNNYK